MKNYLHINTITKTVIQMQTYYIIGEVDEFGNGLIIILINNGG